MTHPIRISLIVFLASCSSLAYEILLTRIFSISLWYHFAFMIVSIAMLGLGASGTALSLFPRLKTPSHLGIYGLLLGMSVSLSYLVANQIPFDPIALSWAKMELLYIGLYYIVLAVPFFIAGLIVATALSSISDRSGLIYGADLLGAGLGCLGVLVLLTLATPEQAVFIVSMVATSTAFWEGGKRLRTIASAGILISLLLAVVHPQSVVVRMSPYKGLQVALRYPGAEHLTTHYGPFSQIDLFRSPAVRYAPGMSFRYLEPLPDQIGISIDGGDVSAITSPHHRPSLAFLGQLPSALPYALGAREDVLVLDPKGGLQVLMADYYGAKRVYKVESTPSLTGVIQGELGSFSGGIYSELTWSQLGRTWLRSTEMRFDLIDLSFTGALPATSLGISEDYRFTVEAFKEYIRHLEPEGVLSIHLYLLPPPRTELRLVTLLVAAMEELGIREVERHVAAIRSWGSLCILTKRSPLGEGEIGAIKSFSRDRRFDLVHTPGIRAEETNVYVQMNPNEYYEAFCRLLHPDRRDLFIAHYLFDIRPVRDENPFFHNFLRLKNIHRIYRMMGEKWEFFIAEGYLLPAILGQVLVLSLLLVLLPVLSQRRVVRRLPGREGPPSGLLIKWLMFFACLGMGFMFVEISLIQKMVLPLEKPSYAAAVVLASLLISSGAGSLLSYRSSRLRTLSMAGVVSLLIMALSFCLPLMSEVISPWPARLKTAAVCLALFPLGVFMGTLFPTGLKILGETYEALIPWAWAVNGSVSVLAPLLAVMMAMALGFRWVLWTGAGGYFLAFLIASSLPLRSAGRRQQAPSAPS
jgi:hypothetical protein